MSDGYRFRRGDFIEVTAKRTDGDFGVIRGAALVDREYIGEAAFNMELMDGQILKFNLNDVEVVRLFSSDIARGVSEQE